MGGVDDICHFDADEPAAAGRVGEQVLLIAGGDERGIPGHFQYGVGVGLAHVHYRLLKNMF